MVGSIDPRREAHRRGHWRSDAAGVFGPRIADTILARGRVRPHPKGRTYDRKRSHPKSAPRPLQAGAVHIWPLASFARVGLTAVLHTWGSALTHHPHVHMIVPGGGMSPDGTRWIACRPGFFLPVRVLSRLFRRLFLDGLVALH